MTLPNFYIIPFAKNSSKLNTALRDYFTTCVSARCNFNFQFLTLVTCSKTRRKII